MGTQLRAWVLSPKVVNLLSVFMNRINFWEPQSSHLWNKGLGLHYPQGVFQTMIHIQDSVYSLNVFILIMCSSFCSEHHLCLPVDPTIQSCHLYVMIFNIMFLKPVFPYIFLKVPLVYLKFTRNAIFFLKMFPLLIN